MSKIDYGPNDFARIRSLYNEAERFIKHVETHQSQISIPAINELRYAGHHLLNSLATGDTNKFCDELGKAERHCQRAMYEASESGIIYFLDIVNEFAGDYKDVPIPEVIQDYSNTLILARKARKQLQEGRLNRASAEEQAGEYMDTFCELEGKIETLQASRSELNKVKVVQVKNYRRFMITMMLALIGVIISAITLLTNLW